MSTQVDTETKLSEGAPPCWPPLAHLIREEDRPVKKGTLALCGEKLMGLDLSNVHVTALCKKCVEIFRRTHGL